MNSTIVCLSVALFLSIHVSVCLSACLPVCFFVFMFVYLHVSINLYVNLSLCLLLGNVILSMYVSIYINLYVLLSVCLSLTVKVFVWHIVSIRIPDGLCPGCMPGNANVAVAAAEVCLERESFHNYELKLKSPVVFYKYYATLISWLIKQKYPYIFLVYYLSYIQLVTTPYITPIINMHPIFQYCCLLLYTNK